MENENGGPITSGNGGTNSSDAADNFESIAEAPYRKATLANLPGSKAETRVERNEKSRESAHQKNKVTRTPTQRVRRCKTTDASGESR